MNLTKHQRETFILFNEAADAAQAPTYNRRLQRRLDHPAKERPDEAKETRRGAAAAPDTRF